MTGDPESRPMAKRQRTRREGSGHGAAGFDPSDPTDRCECGHRLDRHEVREGKHSGAGGMWGRCRRVLCGCEGFRPDEGTVALRIGRFEKWKESQGMLRVVRSEEADEAFVSKLVKGWGRRPHRKGWFG